MSSTDITHETEARQVGDHVVLLCDGKEVAQIPGVLGVDVWPFVFVRTDEPQQPLDVGELLDVVGYTEWPPS